MRHPVILLLITLSTHSLMAQAPINALTHYPSKIANQLFEKVKSFPDQTQLSIAITESGKTKYYGVIKQSDTIKPIENHQHVFEIGSITKVFTSTILAQLVVNQKIKLEDPINSYYPFPFKDNSQITFQELANHTSGLPRLPSNITLTDISNPYESYGPEELNTYLKDLLLIPPADSKTSNYSNLGAGLLGHTLGLVLQQDFKTILKEHIFTPFQMTQSFTDPEAVDLPFVQSPDSEGNPLPNWEFDALFGAGGILSTTADLTKFAKAHFGPAQKALTLTSVPTFTINENMQIALGWHLIHSETGQILTWHNGGTAGYTSSMAIDTQNKKAVIILSNLSAFHPEMAQIDNLCFDLIEY